MEFTFDLVGLALAAKPPDWGDEAACPQGARRANTLPYLTNEQRGGQGCIGVPIPHELLFGVLVGHRFLAIREEETKEGSAEGLPAPLPALSPPYERDRRAKNVAFSNDFRMLR
jgi:hypothetical protein